MLNKTLKREKKIKEKRTKEWIDRKKSVETRIADKQKKRNDNLQKRIDGKKTVGKKAKVKSGGGGGGSKKRK